MQIKQVPHPVTGRTGPNGQGETVPQMMWPDHCVQGTRGCALEDGVQFRLDQREREEEKPTFTIRKVRDCFVCLSSAFETLAFGVFHYR